MDASEILEIKALLSSRNSTELKRLAQEGKISRYVSEAALDEKYNRIEDILSCRCTIATKEITSYLNGYISHVSLCEKDKRIRNVLASQCSSCIKEITNHLNAYLASAPTLAEKEYRIKDILSSRCTKAIKGITSHLNDYITKASPYEKAKRIRHILSSHSKEAIKEIINHLSEYLTKASDNEKANMIESIFSSLCSGAMLALTLPDDIIWYVASADESESLNRVKMIISSHLKNPDVLAIAPIIVEKKIKLDTLLVAKHYTNRLEKLITTVNHLKTLAHLDESITKVDAAAQLTSEFAAVLHKSPQNPVPPIEYRPKRLIDEVNRLKDLAHSNGAQDSIATAEAPDLSALVFAANEIQTSRQNSIAIAGHKRSRMEISDISQSTTEPPSRRVRQDTHFAHN